MRSETCDIFCNVIDNYGDIGVCWRLARQLANEHGLAVRLWVDDLNSLTRLCHETDAALESQQCRGVEVRLWSKSFPEVQPAELVIEAFACKLPPSYIEAMAKIQKQSVPEAKMDARRQGLGERDSTNQYSEGDEAAANNADTSLVGRKPVWVNLEYLSAEDWVEGCHKLPSPHPSLPLVKYFFFPGFTKQTGGLMLERDLLARRDAFQNDAAQQQAFWQSIGLARPAVQTLKISLFAYENAGLDGLFDVWASGTQPVLCLVPEERIFPQVGRYFGDAVPCMGSEYVRGNLQVRVLPFVEQEHYDELLWVCDVNFVRGEDSWVRAQWAGRPFIWQIYPQHDAVHLKKLEAFLMLYGKQLGLPANKAVQDLWRAWNPSTGSGQATSTGSGQATSTGSGQATSTGSGQAWPAFAAARGELDRHARQWTRQLAENNLALNLLDFSKEIGRMRALKIEGQ